MYDNEDRSPRWRSLEFIAKGMLVVCAAMTLVACAPGGSGSGDSGSSTTSHPIDPPAELAWNAPTNYTDGSLLTGILMYRLYYGSNETGLRLVLEIPNVGSSYLLNNAEISHLAGAMAKNSTHFFALTAVDSHGLESMLSSAFQYI